MDRFDITEACEGMDSIIDRVTAQGVRAVITRDDIDVAAIVSFEELQLLDVLIDRYESELDVSDARQAINEHSPRVGWDSIKRKFEL